MDTATKPKVKLKHALTATAMAYIQANNVWRAYLGMKPRPVRARRK